MVGQHLSREAIASLCEKELEILRLLASGHTAKSIAARLERTETAINERLREARRKTGIGSSRELARLLAAQKIWDKNIDLPASGTPGERRAAPRLAGRPLTKGRLMLLVSLPFAALGLTLAAGSTADRAEPAAHLAAEARTPLAGRWALDIEGIPAAERPRSVTISFAVAPDRGWTTEVAIVAEDGSSRTARSTARLDGRAVPVSGTMDFIDSVALRQPDASTLVMTLGKGGRQVSTRVYTVAADGLSMTETIVSGADTVPGIATTTFTRIG